MTSRSGRTQRAELPRWFSTAPLRQLIYDERAKGDGLNRLAESAGISRRWLQRALARADSGPTPPTPWRSPWAGIPATCGPSGSEETIMSGDRKTLTVPEAAALLGISRNSAYRAVRDGDLPAFRVRRRVLIPADGLYAMLAVIGRSTGEE